jgi:5'(3')-deoxyribonucleotidase
MKNLAELLQVNEEPLPRLYCDMDQVLVAFLNGAKQITGQTISNVPRFWENLQFMPGARRLLQRIQKYDPYILSAYTEKDSRSKAGKIKWVLKNTRIPKSRIVVVKRAQKQSYATHKGEFSVLIDDYIKNIKEWENKGGVGIHHTDVSKTLKELTNLGFK